MIVFDMDNTLFDFNGAGGLDKMHEQGFFANMKPYPRAVESLRELVENGNKVFILSACIDSPFCKSEKLESLRKHFPFIPAENVLLVEVGQVKAIEFMKWKNMSFLDRTVWLVDDFKKNLVQWMEYGGTAVKAGKQYKPERMYDLQLVNFDWRI